MEAPDKVVAAGFALGNNLADILLEIASQTLNTRINTKNSFQGNINLPLIDINSIEVIHSDSIPSAPVLKLNSSKEIKQTNQQLTDDNSYPL